MSLSQGSKTKSVQEISQQQKLDYLLSLQLSKEEIRELNIISYPEPNKSAIGISKDNKYIKIDIAVSNKSEKWMDIYTYILHSNKYFHKSKPLNLSNHESVTRLLFHPKEGLNASSISDFKNVV